MLVLWDLILTCVFAVAIAVLSWMRGRDQLIAATVAAAVGFLTYRLVAVWLGSAFFPTFFAATAIGLAAEISSRLTKTPALVIMLPGIFTLVPGSLLYSTMLFFVQRDFWRAIEYAVQTTFVAAGIALGILTASMFSVSLARMRRINIHGKSAKKR